jgi:chemotaxis protein MotA
MCRCMWCPRWPTVPAFGIVVAVMGVVNVMGSVGQPPAVLGKMIGGALVGTFLGILVSYGFVAPVAGQLEQKVEEEGKIYQASRCAAGQHERLCAAGGGRVRPQGAGVLGRPADVPIELEDDLKARKGK